MQTLFRCDLLGRWQSFSTGAHQKSVPLFFFLYHYGYTGYRHKWSLPALESYQCVTIIMLLLYSCNYSNKCKHYFRCNFLGRFQLFISSGAHQRRHMLLLWIETLSLPAVESCSQFARALKSCFIADKRNFVSTTLQVNIILIQQSFCFLSYKVCVTCATTANDSVRE